jgi:membrane associated rhomboid family serine protease
MEEMELDYSVGLEPEVPSLSKFEVPQPLSVPGPAGISEPGTGVEVKKKRMNPLARIQYNAPVTLTFALLSLAVLGLAQLTGGNSNFWFSVSRGSWSDPTLYLRLFTHVLGHANWSHYFGNFLMILLLGPILEEKYGSAKLALMMVVTAFVTGILHILFSPFGILGASGIVFMMILLASFTEVKAGRIPLTLILIMVLYIGQEVVSWVTTDTNIAHWAHIVGGLCGGVFGFLMKPRRSEVAGLPGQAVPALKSRRGRSIAP